MGHRTTVGRLGDGIRPSRLASFTLRILLVGLLAAIALAGCQRASRQADQAPEVQMTLAVLPDPPAVGPATLAITLRDGEGRAIPGAALRIKGDMSHAGMVPVRSEAVEGTDGTYQADFQWTMGGDWIVTVIATLPDGRLTSRQFEFSVSTGAP